MEERIQKILARAGYGSRRACEELIAAGRVRVNGKPVGLGDKAEATQDTITVDGARVTGAEALAYIALYKPRGVLSAVESPDLRQTVRDLVDLPGRLYPVGRLDVDSEGLILMTNDGELANRLTHPRYGHEKEYRVLVARRPDDEQLSAWRRGVVLEDGHRTAPAEVRIEALYGRGCWLRVILREGRKRQIRETGSQLGLPVVKIIRVRIGSLYLGSLKPREWRLLTPLEVAALRGEDDKGGSKDKQGAARQRKAGDGPYRKGDWRRRPGTAGQGKERSRDGGKRPPSKPRRAENEPRRGGGSPRPPVGPPKGPAKPKR
jgi:23S rRNA pseudouridine2605 synthase